MTKSEALNYLRLQQRRVQDVARSKDPYSDKKDRIIQIYFEIQDEFGLPREDHGYQELSRQFDEHEKLVEAGEYSIALTESSGGIPNGFFDVDEESIDYYLS